MTRDELLAALLLERYDNRSRALERFWSYVDRSGSCWLWTGYENGNGYGRFYLGRYSIYAHRLSYHLDKGPIPEGLVIDHLCRVHNCVNPSHLEAVTNAENVRRGAKGRMVTACVNGHAYTPENTYVRPSGGRSCRTCNRHRQLPVNERRKAARRAARA